MNQLLNDIRRDVANSGIEKTGKNPHFKSTFFTLDDIMNVTHKVFAKYKVTDKVQFFMAGVEDSKRDGLGLKLETEDGKLIGEWTLPFIQNPNSTNPVQDMGASLTYTTRRLYMMALNIAEVDTDGESVQEVKRNVAKETLTNKSTEKKATKPQLKALKDKCIELDKVGTDKERAIVADIIEKSNNFTELDSKTCTNWTLQIIEQLKKKEGSDGK